MIDPSVIQKIKDVATIREVVEDYVPLQKRGVNYVGKCPFHDDNHPSFYVSPARNYCKCFVCQEGGDPIRFLMKHENIGFIDAIRLLAKKYGIEIEEKQLSDEERKAMQENENLRNMANWLAQHCSENLSADSDEADKAKMYLMQQLRLRQDTINQFGIGLALKGASYSAAALSKGYKSEQLQRIGISRVDESGNWEDLYAGSIIIPFHTVSGSVVAFAAMNIESEEVKYTPDSSIFNSWNSLFGLYHAKRDILNNKKCLLTESPLDILGAWQVGIKNIVASCGKELSDQHINILKRTIPAKSSAEDRHITLIYENTQEGIKKAQNTGRNLVRSGISVHIVELPKNESLASYTKGRNAEEVQNYITEHEKDFINYYTERLNKVIALKPQFKEKALEEVGKLLTSIPDLIVRDAYIKSCASQLKISQDSLTKFIN